MARRAGPATGAPDAGTAASGTRPTWGSRRARRETATARPCAAQRAASSRAAPPTCPARRGTPSRRTGRRARWRRARRCRALARCRARLRPRDPTPSTAAAAATMAHRADLPPRESLDALDALDADAARHGGGRFETRGKSVRARAAHARACDPPPCATWGRVGAAYHAPLAADHRGPAGLVAGDHGRGVRREGARGERARRRRDNRRCRRARACWGSSRCATTATACPRTTGRAWHSATARARSRRWTTSAASRRAGSAASAARAVQPGREWPIDAHPGRGDGDDAGLDGQGRVVRTAAAAAPVGTVVSARNLFHRLPVRRRVCAERARAGGREGLECLLVAYSVALPGIRISLARDHQQRVFTRASTAR